MSTSRLTGRQLKRVASIGAIFGAALLVFFLAARSGGDTYELVAGFDDVRGLLEGGEVTAGSIKVGTVEEIRLGDDGYPIVRMSVDEDFRLREGGIANIKLASNVGAVNRYVDLVQGDGDELPDGAELGREQTDQPVDLDLAVSTLDPRTRADIAAVLAGVDAATVGRGRDFDTALLYSARALEETADLLHQVNSDRVAVRTLVRDGRRVVGALASDPAALGAVTEELAAALRTTAGRQAELAEGAERLGPALREGRLLLEQFSASTGDVRRLLAAARPTVEELAPLARVLPEFAAALAPTVAATRDLIEIAPPHLRTVRGVITAAIPVIGRLDTILAQLNPVLDHLRSRAPEVVSFFTLLADVTSNYDANGNLVRSTAPMLQFNRHPNLIGPSNPAPGTVIRPYDRTPGSLEGEAWKNYWRTFIGGGRLPQSFITEEEEQP